jgi:hypothetical protein
MRERHLANSKKLCLISIQDGRGWEKRTTIRQRLFWLAAEACLEL